MHIVGKGKERNIEKIKTSYVGRRTRIPVTCGNRIDTVDVDALNTAMNNHHNDGSAFKHTDDEILIKRNDLPVYNYSENINVTPIGTGFIINEIFYSYADLKGGITVNKVYHPIEQIINKFLPKQIDVRYGTKIDNMLHDLNMNSIDTRSVDQKEVDRINALKKSYEDMSFNSSKFLLNKKTVVNKTNNLGNETVSVTTFDIENELWVLDTLFKEFIDVQPDLRFNRVSRFPISDLKLKSSSEPFYPYLSVEWVIYNLYKSHIDNSGFMSLFKSNALLSHSEDLTEQTYGSLSLEETLSKILFNKNYSQDSNNNYYKDITIICNVGDEIRQVTTRFYLFSLFKDHVTMDVKSSKDSKVYEEYRKQYINVRINSLEISPRPNYVNSISINKNTQELEENIVRFITNDIRVNLILKNYKNILDFFTDTFSSYRTNILSFDFERGSVNVEIKQDVCAYRYQEALDIKRLEDSYEC